MTHASVMMSPMYRHSTAPAGRSWLQRTPQPLWAVLKTSRGKQRPLATWRACVIGFVASVIWHVCRLAHLEPVVPTISQHTAQDTTHVQPSTSAQVRQAHLPVVLARRRLGAVLVALQDAVGLRCGDQAVGGVGRRLGPLRVGVHWFGDWIGLGLVWVQVWFGCVRCLTPSNFDPTNRPTTKPKPTPPTDTPPPRARTCTPQLTPHLALNSTSPCSATRWTSARPYLAGGGDLITVGVNSVGFWVVFGWVGIWCGKFETATFETAQVLSKSQITHW
jgi:hypothetical protein